MTGIIQALLGSFPTAAAGIRYVGAAVGYASSNTISVSLTGLTGGIASSPSQNDVCLVYAGCASTASRAFTIQNNNSSSFPYAIVESLYANGSNDANLDVSTRVVGASAETTVNVSHNGVAADTIVVYVSVWRGLNLTEPVDKISTTGKVQSATATNTLIANPPTITPENSGAYIVAGAIGAAPTTAIAANGVYTSSDLTAFRSVGGNGGTRGSVVGAGYRQWTGGAFDPAAFGISNITDGGSRSYAAITLTLLPA